MKNITGENNKLVFVLKDGSEVTEFTGKEIELLENFSLVVQGNNNMVRIKVDKRDDIEKFLNNLIRAVSGEKLMAPEKIEKYYYFKDN